MATVTSRARLSIIPQSNLFDWVLRFLDHYTVQGPSNTAFIEVNRRDGLTHPENHPDFRLAKGITACHFAWGQGTQPMGITVNSNAQFSTRNPVSQTRPGLHFSQFQSSDTDAVVQTYRSGTPAKYKMTDFSEVYDGTAIVRSANPTQYKRFWWTLGEQEEAAGYIMGSEYEGVLSLTSSLNDSAMHTALESPANAYAYCVARGHGYWLDQLHDHGVHPVNKVYYEGKTPHDRFFQYNCETQIIKMALQHLNSNKLMIACTQSEIVEMQGYSLITDKTLPEGGRYRAFHDASWPPNAMRAYHRWIAQDHPICWDFGAPGLYGKSTTTLRQPYTVNGGSRFSFDPLGSGNSPAFTNPRINHDQTRDAQFGANGGPYPESPMGHGDMVHFGYNEAGEMERWVGSKAWSYPTIQRPNQAAFVPPSSGHGMLKTIWENKLGWFRFGHNPATKKLWLSGELWCGVAKQDFNLTCGPLQIPVTLYPGQTHTEKITYVD